MDQKLEAVIYAFQAYLEERRAVDSKRRSLQAVLSHSPNYDIEAACEKEKFHAQQKMTTLSGAVKEFVIELVKEPEVLAVLLEALPPAEPEVPVEGVLKESKKKA